MSDTKFQASMPRGLEVVLKNFFFQNFYLFLWFKPRTPCSGSILEHYLKKLGKGLLAKANFQAPEPSSSGEDFRYISFSNPRPPAAGPFWTLGSPTKQTW